MTLFGTIFGFATVLILGQGVPDVNPLPKTAPLFTFDLGAAVAVGSAVGSGIAFAAKILVTYFKQRDEDKDKFFQERNLQWQERFTASDERWSEHSDRILKEIETARSEKREETQMILGILRDTVSAVAEIKQQFLETNEKMRNENLKAIGELRESLSALTTRISSWETRTKA